MNDSTFGEGVATSLVIGLLAFLFIANCSSRRDLAARDREISSGKYIYVGDTAYTCSEVN